MQIMAKTHNATSSCTHAWKNTQRHGRMFASDRNQKTRGGCGCPTSLAGRIFRQILTLLEKPSPIFWRHEMLSLPTAKVWALSGKANGCWRISPAFGNTLGFSPPRLGIPATCYRTENAQVPKSAGRVLGRVPGKRGLLFQRNRPPGTAPGSPPSSPLFPGTLPSTLPGTFGDLGVLSPVAGRWDSNPRPQQPSSVFLHVLSQLLKAPAREK